MSRYTVRLSRRLKEQFEAGYASTEPRNASTVILLRESVAGPEVYLMHRHAGMAFASGYYVFPGGGVDPGDFNSHVGWAGPSPDVWARRLGCAPELAGALVCAAVRETFEESGVLLAGSTPDSVVTDVSDATWEADRAAIEARELSFTDFLSRRRLVVRSDMLRFWARWITPEFEPKRFDTRFFVATLPQGQTTRNISSESDEVTWMALAEVMHRLETDAIDMLPPTFMNLRLAARHRTVAEILSAAADRGGEPVRPRLEIDEDGAFLVIEAD